MGDVQLEIDCCVPYLLKQLPWLLLISPSLTVATIRGWLIFFALVLRAATI